MCAVNNSKYSVTRDELYELVWTTPARTLASSFNVSGSYLARVCAALNVPRPAPGYWQKKAVGKDAPKPDLPEAKPGDQQIWERGTPLTPVRKEQLAAGTVLRKAGKQSKRSGPHPLVAHAEPLYLKTRTIGDDEFLRPYKYLLPDILTSPDNLRRSLETAGKLYDALEQQGYRVMIAAPDNTIGRIVPEIQEARQKDSRYGRYYTDQVWSPSRPTVVWVAAVPVGLILTEMTERVTMRYLNGKDYREDSPIIRKAKSWQLERSWTSQKDVPSGRLRLIAYSAHRGTGWKLTWQETGSSTIVSQLASIVDQIKRSKDEIAMLMTEADNKAEREKREWEEMWDRRDREEDAKNIQKAFDDSRMELLNVMQQWQQAVTIENFFTEVSNRLEREDPQRRVLIEERLQKARSLLGSTDPLIFLEKWREPEERYQSKYR